MQIVPVITYSLNAVVCPSDGHMPEHDAPAPGVGLYFWHCRMLIVCTTNRSIHYEVQRSLPARKRELVQRPRHGAPSVPLFSYVNRCSEDFLTFGTADNSLSGLRYWNVKDTNCSTSYHYRLGPGPALEYLIWLRSATASKNRCALPATSWPDNVASTCFLYYDDVFPRVLE